VSGRLYLGIALEYASTVNPEPGVRRAPTIDEQARALARASASRGGSLSHHVVTARQNHGVDKGVIDALADAGATGAYCLTIDVFRRGDLIDDALLADVWSATGCIGFLIEDVHLEDDGSYLDWLDMVRAINAVRARDASAPWRSLVSGGGAP
jgi:hypothetical protein